MGKSFEFKECERFLKRVLKDKGMYSKGAVIAFLITGGIGFVAPVLLGDSVYAATYKWVKIQTETGRTFSDGEQDGETNSVILAPTSGNDLTVSPTYKISPGIFNRKAMNSVIIGYGAYGNALSTETTPGSFTAIGALAHSYGAQGTAVGSGTIAGIQATAIGNDVYATGDSSIAIGNDDIATKYRDQLSLETMKSVYGAGPGKGLFESKEFKSSYSNGENKKNLSVLDWNRFSSSYLTGDNLIYNPTISRGIGSIAIGSRSIAAKDGSTAIGTLAYAFAEGSTAMGLRAFTSADAVGAVAIGEQSRSFARGSLAVGNRNESTNLGSMSYGYNAKAVGEGSLAFGYNVLANAAITNTIAGAGDTKPPTNVYRKALMDNTQGLTYEQLKYIRLYDASLKEYAEVLNKPITDTYTEADKKRDVEHYRLNVVDSKKEYDKVIKAFTNSGANAAGKNGRNLEDVNNLDLVNKADTTDKSGNTVTAVGAAISDIIGKTTNTTDSTLNVSLEKDTKAGKYLTTTDKNADGTESRKEIYKLKANGKNAIAIGYYTAATGDSSIAQGAGTIVESSSGIGIGSLSYVSDEAKNGIAVGVGSQVRNANSIAIGTQAAVYGAKGVSMGPGARVIGDESMALGYGSFVKTKDSTALGVGTTIEYGANESMALGTKAYVGTGNIATLSIGNSARVEENSVNSASIGASSKIGKQSSNSVVLGTSSTIGDLAPNSVVLGSHASISDQSSNSMALGAGAKITNSAKSSIALGEGSSVSASSSLAFGRNSSVTGESSIAIGRNSTTTTESSVALGRGASADFNNSVALGYRSTTFYYGDAATRQAGTSTTVSGTYKHGLDIEPYLPDSAGKGIKEKLAHLNTAAAGYISVGGWDVTKNEDGTANASGAGATLRGLRRIVNVAPGALDTDAVTVAQLREWTDKSAHFLSLAGAENKSATDFKKEIAPDGVTEVSSNFDNDGASGEHALALGVYAKGQGAGSVSIGRSSFGQGTNSTTLGSYGWGRGTEATSIGYRAYSYGEQSVALGTRTVTDSDYGVAIGNRARSWSEGSNGHSGIAIGSKATANYWNALALGTESKVRGWHSTAIGANAQVGMPEVFDDNGVSMNVFNADGKSLNKAQQVVYEKTGETNTEYTVKEYRPGTTTVTRTFTIQKPSTIHNALAFGPGASVTNDRVTDAKDSTRVNEFSSAGSIAIGASASVKGSQNSVALGLNSKVVRTDTEAQSTAAFTGDKNNDPGNGVVSIGTIRNTSDGRGVTRRIVGVAGGQDDFDAVNVKQLKTAVKYYKTNTSDTANRTVNSIADVSANYNGEGATGTASVTLGSYTKASGNYSTAIGRDVITSGTTAVGIGTNVSAFGNSSVVLGSNAIAGYTKTEDSKTVPVGATEGVAIGNSAAVESSYAIAIGGNAKVLRDTSDANAIKDAESSVAIGAGAQVTGAKYSVALGLNSRVNAADTATKTTAAFSGEVNDDPGFGVVSVGQSGKYRRILNVAGGMNDNDAVNVKQLRAAAWGLQVESGTAVATDVTPDTTSHKIKLKAGNNVTLDNTNGVVTINASGGLNSITSGNEDVLGVTTTNGAVTITPNLAGSVTNTGDANKLVTAGVVNTAIGNIPITSFKADAGGGTNTAGVFTPTSAKKQVNITGAGSDGTTNEKWSQGSARFYSENIGTHVNSDGRILVGLKDAISVNSVTTYKNATNGDRTSNVGASLTTEGLVGNGTDALTISNGDYAKITVNKGTSSTDKGSINVNGSKLTGLADGNIAANSTDAVTGGQLHSKLAEKADKSELTTINTELGKKANASDLAAKANASDLAGKLDKTAERHVKSGSFDATSGTITLTMADGAGTVKTGEDVTISGIPTKLGYKAGTETGKTVAVTTGLTFKSGTGTVGATGTGAATTNTATTKTGIAISTEAGGIVNIGLDEATRSAIDNAATKGDITTINNALADKADKSYVNTKVGEVSNLGYKANGGTAKSIAVTTGLDFVQGDGTTATAESAKSGLNIVAGDNGKVIIGLSEDAKTKLDKVNTIAQTVGANGVDGRDGKPGTGADAGMGAQGPTGQDGLNGKDLTSKVNALRNGEAGTVVYTDESGKRVVKAKDGKWYLADKVGADGTKADDAVAVATPQARLVNPDGTTTGGTTKLSNIADGNIAAGSTDAINGGQLHSKLAEKADKSDITTINNTLADKANASDLNTLAEKPLTFSGDTGTNATRKLGTTLAVKGAANFTPAADATRGVNIQVASDPTNGLTVSLADTLTGMKGISGNGTDPLVIKNGDQSITITPTTAAETSPDGTVTKQAQAGKIDFGTSKLTSSATPTETNDLVNKGYLETAIQNVNKVATGNANLGYKANGGTAKSVAVTTGLNFVQGDGTTNTAETAKAGIEIVASDNGKVIIGLSDDVKTKLDKVNTIAATVGTNGVDGRDGKPGTGTNAGIGKDGLTAEDGLNGKDLTSKVNALRNGEAGSVVYTDAEGNRVVKSEDGKWYNAKAVDEKGKLKPADQLPQGVTRAEVTHPQARLVNADGTTTGGTTVFNNVASAIPAAAADGANPTFLDNLNTAAGSEKTKHAAVNVSDLNSTATEIIAKGLTFQGNDQQGIKKALGTTLDIVGEGTVPATTTTAANNIRTKKNDDGKLEIGLAKDLVGITSITNGDTTITVKPSKPKDGDKPAEASSVDFGGAKLTNVGEAKDNTDAVNKAYVDSKIGGVAEIGYKADTDTDTKKVAVSTGLTFKSGTGTIAPTNLAPTAESPTKDTDTVKTKKGIVISTEKDGVVNIGLDEATRKVIDNAAKIGDTAVDGRDGKPANGKTGTAGNAGDHGLTGADGLNGKDLTNKVNALRNGEAGTVVYTDDQGNRLAKANDGNYYLANKVNADGTKTDDAVAVTNPQARLVNPDGTTTTAAGVTGTVLSNIANGKIADKSTDAVTGGQLHTVKTELATALGGNATVDANGALTKPTYSITKDDEAGGKETVNNVGAAVDKLDTRINTVKGMAAQPLTFTGDDGQGVERKLDTILTVKGAVNFTPTATNPTTAAGVNIRVEKDPTTNANGLVVKLADTLTGMKGITGTGNDDLVIKNGDTTITIGKGTPAQGTTVAVPGPVNFGGATLTNVGDANADTDATNKKYVDDKVAGLNLGYKAETEAAKSVAVTTGLTFKAGTGTIAPTNLPAGTTSTTEATDTVKTKKGIVISTENDGVVNIGLDEATRKVIDNAAKIGDTAVDGRDGKPANGKTGTAGNAGDHGLTGADGLNGKDLTNKVNALRNGEAGTVVYTDDQGNRLVKANDGNYYPAGKVNADGTKADDAVAVANPQARLVNPDGSTTIATGKTGTVLNNVASSIANVEAKDAQNQPITTPTFLERLNTAAGDAKTQYAAVNVSDLNNTATDIIAKGLTFQGNDGSAITKALGTTLDIVGEGTVPATTTTAANNIRTKKNNDGKLEIGLAKDLVGITSIANETDATKPSTKVEIGKDGITVTNTQPADATAGTAATTSKVTVGKDGVKVGNKVTINTSGMSGNGTDPLTITNGDTTITVKPSKAAVGDKPAEASSVDFGGAKLTNVGEAKADTDATNKAYVDSKVGAVSKLGYKANTETETKKVGVADGLHFKSGTGTIDATGTGADVTNAATTKTGIAISTEDNGVVNIGLDEATRKVIDQAAKLGDTSVDGRDGKPGTGATAGMGKDGVTGQDGLNGTDLTTKVNALRNGEAGSVVYTDADGNRLVRATDGKFYKASEVKPDGTVKAIGEDGITKAPVGLEADKVIASLVSPNGATAPKADDADKKAMTKLSNIAEGSITATSNDAVTGRQLHAERKALATVLGGNAGVADDGTWTKPTYTITNDGGATPHTVDNVGSAVTKLDARITDARTYTDTKVSAANTAGMNFVGDDTASVHRNLGDTLTVKGANNFTPAADATAGVNIRVEKDPTTDANGLVVKLADTLTNMKGISGDGEHDLVIKNGTNTITMTAGTAEVKNDAGVVTKKADPGTVNFGDAIVTVKNLDASITYRANGATGTDIRTVKLKDGFNFVAGTGTIAATGATSATTNAETTKKGITITTGENGAVTIGLDAETRKTIDNAGKIGNTASDGRDGKTADGTGGAAGDKGLTGQDGLNGADLTTKVNALRNGEAGTVVYTDETGSRLVKANDGKYYKANEVDKDGNVITPTGGTTPTAATTVEARLVNPDGTTTTATVFNNVASSIEHVKVTDADNKEVAKPTFLERLTTAATTTSSKLGVVNVKDLYDASKDIVNLGLDFYGNDETEATGKVHRNLGTAVKIQGAGTFTRDVDKTNNINVKRNTAQDGFTVELAENLTGMKEVAGNDTDTLVLRNGKDTATNTKVAVDTNKFTVTTSTSTPATTAGEAAKVTTGTIEMNAEGTTTFTNSEAPTNAVTINSKSGAITTGHTTVNGSSVSVVDGDSSVVTTASGTTITKGSVTTTATAGKTEYKDGDHVTTVSTDGMTATDGTDVAMYTAGGSTFTDANSTATHTAAGTTFVAGDHTANHTALTSTYSDGTNTVAVGSAGITITPSAAGDVVSLTNTGLNNGGNVITNVAAGTADTDAVNVKQLKAGKTTFSVNDKDSATTNHNLVLTTTTDATDGHTHHDVKLADTVTLGKDGNAVTVDGTNGSIIAGKDDNAVTVDGANGKITTGHTEVTGSAVTIKDAANDAKKTTVDATGTTVTDGTTTTTATAGSTIYKNGTNETTVNTTNVVVKDGTATTTTKAGETKYDANGKNLTVNTDGITVKDGNNTGSINAMNSTFTNATNGTQVGPTLIRVNGENKNNAIEGGIAIGYHADVVTSVATATKETGNFITGLVNTTWNPKANGIVSGRAATEDQLKAVDDKVNKGRVFTADTKVGDKPLEAMVGLGDTLSIKGGADMTALTDNNIGVELKDAETKDGKVVTPATMTVKLAKDVKMGDGSTSYVSNLPEYERDEHGNVIYYKDKFGTVLPKEKVDATGHTIYRTGKDNTPITLRTTKVDGNSTTHILYKTENGNIVVNEDGKPVIDVITGVGANGIAITSNGKPSVTLTSKGLDNGGNTISNIAPGVYESDAATVGQLNTVSNTVTTKVNEAGAHAAALAAMNPLSYDPLKKSQVMAGVGAYKGNKALALGVAHYANEDTMFNVGVSVGGGSNMMNAGVTYRFGGEDSMIPERYKGGPISSVYILQDEVSALKAENAQVKADNEQVKADNARMKENYEKVMQDNEEMKAQIKMLMAHMGIK